MPKPHLHLRHRRPFATASASERAEQPEGGNLPAGRRSQRHPASAPLNRKAAEGGGRQFLVPTPAAGTITPMDTPKTTLNRSARPTRTRLRTPFVAALTATLLASCTPPQQPDTTSNTPTEDAEDEEQPELGTDVVEELDELAGTLDRHRRQLHTLQNAIVDASAADFSDTLSEPVTFEIEQRIEVINTSFDRVANLEKIDLSVRGVLQARLDDAGNTLAALQAELETIPFDTGDHADSGPPPEITVIEEGEGDIDIPPRENGGPDIPPDEHGDHGEGEPATPREDIAEQETAIGGAVQQLGIYHTLVPLTDVADHLNELHTIETGLHTLAERFERRSRHADNTPEVRSGLERITAHLQHAADATTDATLELGATLLTTDQVGPALNTAVTQIDAVVDTYNTEKQQILTRREELLDTSGR